MQLETKIHELISQQTSDWPLATLNYTGLAKVEERVFQFEGFQIKAQFNPGRIHSSAAKTDKVSITKRLCFLCKAHRPGEQLSIDFRNKYEILINPFPIFERHLTIVAYEHVPQHFAGRLADMLALAEALPDFTIFYNGPGCGASAPDHFHFQAANKGIMPVDLELDELLNSKADLLSNKPLTQIYAVNESYLRNLIVFQSSCQTELIPLVEKVLQRLPQSETDDEPMMNILANVENGNYRLLLFPRDQQRPYQYFRKGPEQILMSPASVEMGGLAILPRREDFLNISKEDLIDIYSQVSMNNKAFEDLKTKIKKIDETHSSR